MKLLTLAVLATMPLFAAPASSSEADSYGDRVLKTSSSIIPLFENALIARDGGQNISLQPGVRANFAGGSWSISSHDGSSFVLVIPSGNMIVPSPTLASATPIGWKIAGNAITGEGFIIARLKNQDDTDSNLKSMQESAKKLKSKTNDNNQDNKGPTKKLKVRWLYGENPNPTAELFNSAAIQQLTHLSNIGF